MWTRRGKTALHVLAIPLIPEGPWVLTCHCRIASLREDSSSLTTYLAAEPAPWSDVAGTYDLDFGHVVTAGHLEKRHFWDHDIDFTKTKDIDEKLGHENKRETIYHDSK